MHDLLRPVAALHMFLRGEVRPPSHGKWGMRPLESYTPVVDLRSDEEKSLEQMPSVLCRKKMSTFAKLVCATSECADQHRLKQSEA